MKNLSDLPSPELEHYKAHYRDMIDRATAAGVPIKDIALSSYHRICQELYRRAQTASAVKEAGGPMFAGELRPKHPGRHVRFDVCDKCYKRLMANNRSLSTAYLCRECE